MQRSSLGLRGLRESRMSVDTDLDTGLGFRFIYHKLLILPFMMEKEMFYHTIMPSLKL